MAWNRRYSWASSLRSSLWVIPLAAVALEFVVKLATARLAAWMVREGWYDVKTGYYGVDAAEAHAILDRIFTVNLTCLVFAFSSLLVAIQVAGAQYTPRIIASTLLRNRVVTGVVGVFVFTMIWAHRTMLTMGQSSAVPQLQVFLASVFGVVSLIAFVVFIDRGAKFLRPVTLAKVVGEQGIAVIEALYPDPFRDAPQDAARLPSTRPDRVIAHADESGVVLALNVPGLLAHAQATGCVIEFVPQVGDFVARAEPLFHLYGSCAGIDARPLQDCVAIGSERTMEQDPTFAFRIEVDMAIKALSPAINDPTTAVLAIDQLQRLLQIVGTRSLHNAWAHDSTGRPRVLVRTPDWPDFVHLTCQEIRQYGAGSMQIERRLRAMLESLLKTLPPQRHPELRMELDLLERTIERSHAFAEDIALARVADVQGLGGSER